VNIALAVLYAGVISVDRFAAFNLMLSRPIVISFVLGLLFGNTIECFYVGIIFEAIGLVDVPFGTRIPKEDSFGAFAACCLLTLLPCDHLPQYILIFLLVLLMMYPVTMTLHITRSFNKALYVRQQKRGRIYPLRLLMLGMGFSFLRGVVFYSLGTYLVLQIYYLIHGHIDYHLNFYLFCLMIFVFLTGYILRFLSARTYFKYAVFMLGLLTGWVIL